MNGTLGRECLDRMLVFGHGQLRRILTEYVRHYNGHRPHRSLEQRCPAEWSTVSQVYPMEPRVVERRDVIGGLIHEYRWAEAA